MGLSNYPPGVAGGEYAIAGPDYEKERDEKCPVCGEEDCLLEQGYGSDSWIVCTVCEWTADLDKDGNYEYFSDE